jgi:hypothetical protein
MVYSFVKNKMLHLLTEKSKDHDILRKIKK